MNIWNHRQGPSSKMDVEESVRFKKLDLPTRNFMHAKSFEQK